MGSFPETYKTTIRQRLRLYGESPAGGRVTYPPTPATLGEPTFHTFPY